MKKFNYSILFIVLSCLLSCTVGAEMIGPNGDISDSEEIQLQQDQDTIVNAFRTGRICLNMTNGDENWYIQAWIGGSISGTICDSPNWTITNILYRNRIAKFTASYIGNSNCPSSLLYVGYWTGEKLEGEYCFDQSSCYPGTVTLTPCEQ